MNLKLTEEIERIFSFLIDNKNNNLLYVSVNNDFFYNHKLINSEIDSYNYGICNDKLIYVKNEATVVGNDILPNRSYVRNERDKTLSSIVLSGEFLLDYPNYSSNYYLYSLLNRKEEEIVRFTNLKTILSDNSKVFFSNNDVISFFSLSAVKKCCWQINLLSIPNIPFNNFDSKNNDWEVKKFIGVLEGKLWIALNHHTIVALDLETGTLVHQIHDVPFFKSDWLPSAIPLPEATVVDEKNNKLLGFMWEFYWEINPQTGEITLFDLTEDFLVQKVRNDVQNFVLTDDSIYFASHFDSKIAVLNRTTKKIVWHYTFVKSEENKEPRIIQIDGNDEMIGALSSEKTLYVFEKEY